MSDPVRRLGIGRTHEEAPVAPWLAAMHARISPTAAEWALLTSLALTAAPLGLVVGLVFRGTAALVVAATHLVVMAVVSVRGHRRQTQELRGALPVALDALARDLRTGASFASAIERQAHEPGPMAPHFRRVHTAIDLGQAVDEACGALVAGAGAIAEEQTTAGVLTMVSGGGRGSARALEEAASAARQRERVQGEVRALVAQAESSVRVLAALPIVFLGLGMLSGQAGGTALISTAVGRWCLGIGLALDGAGLVWMRTLVRSVES